MDIMVFNQMDLSRLIMVYVVQLGVGIIYLIIGLMILKRSRKRLNQLFSTFYILCSAATLVNVIYASLTLNPAVKILHFLTIFLFCFAIIYLFIFNLIILKSEKVFTIKKHNIIAGIYAASLFVLVFIPGGVMINESTEWKPVWSLPFLIYLLIVLSCATIPTGYYALKVYKKLEEKTLKKKWAYYIIAIFGYFSLAYMIPISNYLNEPTFRLITSIVGLTLIPTAFLLYFGVRLQIE